MKGMAIGSQYSEHSTRLSVQSVRARGVDTFMRRADLVHCDEKEVSDSATLLPSLSRFPSVSQDFLASREEF